MKTSEMGGATAPADALAHADPGVTLPGVPLLEPPLAPLLEPNGLPLPE
jgi:hypothetical protein